MAKSKNHLKNSRFSFLAAGILTTILFPQAVYAQQQPILIPGPAIQLQQANIWGGISYNGENISLTTVLMQNRPQIYLRKVNRDMQQVGSLIQLTFDADPESLKRITDHKHLFLNGCHYIAFSVGGDSDLYLLKADREGRRVGSIVPVVENTTNRTNDMMFTTDGERLYVAYFKPNEQSVVHVLNQNLQPLQPPLTTSIQLPHNNLGGLTYQQGRFYMFTGDKAGPSSNLILTVWNHDWTAALLQRKTLIPAPTGGGYFFATAMAFDPVSRLWYLGLHHVENVNPDANTHIDTAVFDESFRLLEHQHGEAGFRPHFLLLENYLYMVYDRGGVFLKRFEVRPPVTGPISSILTFPNVIHTLTKETGIALVNTSDLGTRLTVEAYGNNGSLIASSGVTNPVQLTLAPQTQIARLMGELFGSGLQTEGGWIRISADRPGVQGFSLSFDPQVETLDGAVAGENPLNYWILPVFEGAEIAVVNPDTRLTAEVILRWTDPQGRSTSSDLRWTLAPRTRQSAGTKSLFPASSTAGGAILGATFSEGIFSSVQFGKAGIHESVLNAMDANAGGTKLWAPQFVSGEGYRSSLFLVNLEDMDTNLTLEVMDSQGRPAASAAAMRLPARGSTIVEDASLFADPPTGSLQGYVRITSSASRITGAVLFSAGTEERSRTALPLVTEGVTEAIFPHLAEDQDYFTGVAAVNLSSDSATVILSVYDPAGLPLGKGTRTIVGNGRFCLALREWIPALPLMIRGYFKLVSNRPLAGFAVFGTRDLRALSALPAQPLIRQPAYGAGREEDYLPVNLNAYFPLRFSCGTIICPGIIPRPPDREPSEGFRQE